jgi:hypothetical protein
VESGERIKALQVLKRSGWNPDLCEVKEGLEALEGWLEERTGVGWSGGWSPTMRKGGVRTHIQGLKSRIHEPEGASLLWAVGVR